MFKQSQKQMEKDETKTSVEEDSANEHTIRLIEAEQTSWDMFRSHLTKWCQQADVLPSVLKRLTQLSCAAPQEVIPIMCHILSTCAPADFEKSCMDLVQSSPRNYLLFRWASNAYLSNKQINYQSFMAKCEEAAVKLPYLLVTQGDLQLEEITMRVALKKQASDFIAASTDFYDRLFRLPERLKSYPKEERNEKLRRRLASLSDLKKAYPGGSPKGFLYPFNNSKDVIVNICLSQSFTFSTRERVPFKVVVETVAYEDADKPTAQSQLIENEIDDDVLVWKSSYFGQLWGDQVASVRQTSKYAGLPSHKVHSFMVKSGDDIRQEYLAMQLINQLNLLFVRENLKLWLNPYQVIAYSSDSGLLEFVPNTRTVSFLKQKSGNSSLRTIFLQLFGHCWEDALMNFVQSLAGYSLVQYLFQVKDRHNNNILIDGCGRMVHIDFGFLLGSSPGAMGFESAPFKMTADYMELLEGKESDLFDYFKHLLFLGLKYVRKCRREMVSMIEIAEKWTGLRCFEYFKMQEFVSRFHETETDEELIRTVQGLVTSAKSSYATSGYDAYQWLTNEIKV